MYGWRAKIGRISPSPETVGAEEWRRFMPDGVCLVETRTLVILQAGTAIAFFRGFGHDQELRQRISAVTGITATTSLMAVIEALRALNANRLAVATSYIAEIDGRLVDVLEKSGFEVSAIRGLGLKKSIDMGKVEPGETYRLAKEVVDSAPGAEAILISCGNLRTFEVIDPLETDTGLPVITSNQAGLWQTLRMAGINERLAGLGRLLQEY
jgi:maleate isomerase